ncbi:uncharacterized protein GLRG_02417 [Colletotrichum graminicola M1.001]|uniref:C2 NT-type domain-containing protein n=1 Tax=Colletotrichum graminicola (strain M1.001 / M2 / FGSC 10212) TaxID=645133 RepID=E3Q6V9_COLGM|nr:uncharacterized protein GLRG_02417 [Colletotrichum graminicola M1.001]EFQ26597.1 hypothetical protein GLRG_02417 [Colletotrichum graminicola M1.001]
MSPLKSMANGGFLPTVNKNRKPKFELHLKIYDLNNVPLVSGTSIVKWHLSHSIHAEHRGRTPKCPISNHKVEYNYSKMVSHIRISIDKNNNLTECPIEFEVLQEFPGTGREEKISLGIVKLNLSEYVEESDAPITDDPDVVDGIVRRYLMQESKINSTLKIGILMLQLDGDKNYSAPPLRTAPVFGGIAGIVAGESVEQDDAGQLPSMAKSRDASEVQDMYRRTLAASWSCQPDELPADQCIEDIFSGGDGWRTGRQGRTGKKTATFDLENGGSLSSDEGTMGGTLRPSDFRKMERKQQQAQQQQQQQQEPPQQDHLHLHRLHNGHRHHSRNNSGSSERSMTTVVTGRGDAASSTAGASNVARRGSHSRLRGREGEGGTSRRSYGRSRSRSGSIVSLAPTMGSSDRGREASRRNRELEEFNVRDDLVAWRLPGAVT